MSEQMIDLPPVEVVFSSGISDDSNGLYSFALKEALRRAFKSLNIFDGELSFSDLSSCMIGQMPLLSASNLSEAPGDMSFYMVSKYRPNAFKFFFEMISRWLVPGKRLDVLMLFAVDFRFLNSDGEEYTFCEVRLNVKSIEELNLILQHFPILKAELNLGLESEHYARHILDIKGLSAEEKTSMVQELILNLINRRPLRFTSDLLVHMQHFLVVVCDSFKAYRESRHMCRIICSHHLFRKQIQESISEVSERRYLKLKCVKARLHLPAGTKNVLGLILGVNFLRDNERLEEGSILKSVKGFIPDALLIEGSFFSMLDNTGFISSIYCEFEKAGGERFSLEEVRLLRQELPNDLKGCVEHLMHPIFMPYNEEEVMRNILMLSAQLKFLRDTPQVMISFDEQSDTSLSFTLIVLRVVKGQPLSIEESFERMNSKLEFIPDRVKLVGYIRKKYAKEATVFRLRFAKASFLRGDNSLDLYKARQLVSVELSRVMGRFRDFNGGMILKQNELFCALKDTLAVLARNHEFLLENFFYSLTPVLMRTILEPAPLKKLFMMLLNAVEEDFFKESHYEMKVSHEDHFLIVMIASDDPSFKREVSRAVSALDLPSLDLATTFVDVYDTHCLGYVYRSLKGSQRERFISVIEGALKTWEGGEDLETLAKEEQILLSL